MTPYPPGRRAPGFATLAVHAGGRAIDARSGSHSIERAAAALGWAAPSRDDDPSVAALEERVAALEGGTAALAVASGPALLGLVLDVLLERGDEFVASATLRGSPAASEPAFASRVRWADPDDPGDLAALLTERTRAILVETLPEPGNGVADVAAFAAAARRARAPLIVDNTRATPYLLRPLEGGADAVLHASTAVLSGRAGPGGVLVDGGRFDWAADGRFPALSRPSPEHGGVVFGEAFGNVALAAACRARARRDPGLPMDGAAAAAALAGVETLPLRMRRHCDGALDVAAFLATHPAVAGVSYPGLPAASGPAPAARRFPRGAGGALAFSPRGGAAALVGALRLFSPDAEPGGARSAAVGLAGGDGSPGPVHLWIGLEDAADLVADLDQALAATAAAG